MVREMYRQGDILLVASSMPVQATRLSHRVLAHGEVTGHKHEVADGVLFEHQGVMYLQTSQPTALNHEEHATITIPEGTYQVIRQREYDEDAIRYVAD
jgi:hypothetical protein